TDQVYFVLQFLRFAFLNAFKIIPAQAGSFFNIDLEKNLIANELIYRYTYIRKKFLFPQVAYSSCYSFVILQAYLISHGQARYSQQQVSVQVFGACYRYTANFILHR